MPDRDDARLDELQRLAFEYFLRECDPATGLVADNSRRGSPCSIAAVGFARTADVVAVERGWLPRRDALARALATARFFAHGAQGDGAHCLGHHGFFYHFLSMRDGRRVWRCEISSIDTALLAAGLLSSAAYFADDAADERELRALVDGIARRIDWPWLLAHEHAALGHGWTPERGALPWRWEGWTEALVLYALACGSPTHPIPGSSWTAATRAHRWRSGDGEPHLHAAPLFIHQLPQCWIDPRGIRDGWMRARPGGGIDLFENGRRATLAQSRYAADNPHGFLGYAADCFGFTACEGPGPATLEIEGRKRSFSGYDARGAPGGPDDGTIAPWGTLASFPYAPEEVARCVRRFHDLKLRERTVHGFKTTFNPTFANSLDAPWMSEYHYGLNQGPIVLMIENHRTGLPWALMRACAPLVRGLKGCGFAGGWLGEAEATA